MLDIFGFLEVFKSVDYGKIFSKPLEDIEYIPYNVDGIIHAKAVREPYSKHLEDGIFELRAKFGSNITRVLYFFMVGRKIVLTNGFVKKTQKTPRSEIETAKAYRKEHLEKEANSDENL